MTGSVPRVIHQIWVGPPMPDHLKRWAKRWEEVNPGWEYRLWGEEDLQWLEHQDLFDDWETHAPRNRGQWQANIARLEILARYGGVYADADLEPLRPIDPLMDKLRTGGFLTWQRQRGHRKGPLITNAFMGGVPDHPVISALVDGLRRNVTRVEGMRCTHTTGVRYITKHLLQRNPRLGRQIDILPSRVAVPYLPDEIPDVDPATYVPPADAYCVHQWHNQRVGGHVGKYR